MALKTYQVTFVGRKHGRSARQVMRVRASSKQAAINKAKRQVGVVKSVSAKQVK